MIQVTGYTQFLKQISNTEKVFALLYKAQGSEQSDCAYKNIIDAENKNSKIEFVVVDVSVVKDIHKNYGVTSVPTLLEFNKGVLTNTIKGCHNTSYYNNIFEGNVFVSNSVHSDVKKQKNVVVYSTPTCSWCNTIKNYFKEHNIKFRDIDVSRDAKAAEDMVKRSGQQGVPQTTINGEVIVGFDKPRIDKLLDIQSK